MAVTIADVAEALGRTAPDPSTATGKQWTYWIARAYRLIEGRYKASYADLAPEAVDAVVVEAVAQHVRAWTPELVRRKDISVDDGRLGVDYYASVGPLEIPESLWAELDPDPVLGGVFSIRMVGEPDAVPPPEVWA